MLYVVTFDVTTRFGQVITCTSEPMPQGELADFLTAIDAPDMTLVGVNRVIDPSEEPEPDYLDEVEDMESEPEEYEDLDYTEPEPVDVDEFVNRYVPVAAEEVFCHA